MKTYHFASSRGLLQNLLPHPAELSSWYNRKKLKFILSITSLLLFMTIANGQADCATAPTTTYYNNTMSGMASGTYEDPIVVKLYVHVVRQDNGSGGATPANLIQQIGWLDERYNQRNIYFDYCFLDFPCSDCFTNITYLKNQ